MRYKNKNIQKRMKIPLWVKYEIKQTINKNLPSHTRHGIIHDLDIDQRKHICK